MCLSSFRVVKLWKESLSKVNQKAADALADPSQYTNLFSGFQQALLAEQYLKETHVGVRPASEYPLITVSARVSRTVFSKLNQHLRFFAFSAKLVGL